MEFNFKQCYFTFLIVKIKRDTWLHFIKGKVIFTFLIVKIKLKEIEGMKFHDIASHSL